MDWTGIINFILGVKMVSVEDAKTTFLNAVDECDRNADGFLDLRELIATFKKLIE